MFEDPAQSDAEPIADIDLAIDKVSMFRLERMDDGVIWIRLYRETGDDKVIWLNSSSAITATVDDDKARAALAQSDAELRDVQFAAQNGARPIPFDRSTGGRIVREAWVRWAQTQPNPKPSWLVPYDELSEPDKEADRQIAQAVARWTLIHDAAALAQSDAEQSGMSWSGFNIRGDRKSIDAVRDALYAKDRCEALDKMISEKQLVRPNASAGLIEAAPNDAVTALLAERERQKSIEGWTPEHDDTHKNGELALAAACYTIMARQSPESRARIIGDRSHDGVSFLVKYWPWSMRYWKPTDRYRDLVKAGALILAELERLARAHAADRSGE